MNQTWLICTSINHPTESIKTFSQISDDNKNFRILVVGDKKTPADYRYKNVIYLSTAQQLQLFPELSKLIPFNHYSRKNLGYLYAIKNGADIIFDTDDDNIPYGNFNLNVDQKITSEVVGNSKWINIYTYFTEKLIWSRGLPLNYIHQKGEYITNSIVDSPIQQYLADLDPDVDAIYRLLNKEEITFNKLVKPISILPDSFVPFNSQNTIFFKVLFPLLYLPCFVSFRMTDIWRSFVAQKIMWKYNYCLSFHSATLFQKRNEHDLMKDFKEEIDGYCRNEEIADKLLGFQLKPNDDIYTDLYVCWDLLRQINIITDLEIKIIEKWLEEIR